ncbi:MerR family transcriptional regulator [Nocardiopsis dassonvillei]|uniref:MerR family transcriptional regulator n=1 Tax=Nocardiopsis dassonvillei TaxID=2014 RepID=UPI00102B7C73|nr:MerR family transcriptional regulator [Nocardiopsis dassonvillei]MCP3012091.1 MerR family transcriptional regulator [Nocardiopsis dassonvillei]
MLMAELSAKSGVPVSTIKYYLREGLLPEGVRTSATRAAYGGVHLHRLRVVRALIDAGVSVAGARKVIATLDDPPENVSDLIGAAHAAVLPRSEGEIDLADAERLAERLGWQPGMCERESLEDVARSLDTLRQAGFEISPNVMTAYIRAVETIAAAEVSDIPVDDPEEAVRYVVLGTALAEPLLLALRRMAEQITAVRRFPPKDQHGNG